MLAGLIVKVWNIFLIIFNAQPILNFSERSLIQLSSTVKFKNIELKISESFSSESGLSKKRHLSFCYIIHEMAIQVDFCYFCLCCFYIVPQHKLWKQTEDKKLRGFDQRVVPPVNCAVNQTCSNKKHISKMQQIQIHNHDLLDHDTWPQPPSSQDHHELTDLSFLILILIVNWDS